MPINLEDLITKIKTAGLAILYISEFGDSWVDCIKMGEATIISKDDAQKLLTELPWQKTWSVDDTEKKYKYVGE